MATCGLIQRGAYFDSVTLMRVARELSLLPGVEDAAVVMGTKENRSILAASNLWLKEFEESRDSDLLIAVRSESPDRAGEVLKTVDVRLRTAGKKGGAGEISPRTLEAAVGIVPDASLALISVAGRYAADEAMKALEKGLHVMIFSDNVPIESEIELKRFAHERGLLVMGPDCGTAIINGVPLGFANAVTRGNIGIVAAAGTGLQEVSSLISNLGGGVSQAIGTGGRDVKEAVGGIMFLDAMEAIGRDEATRVVVLISKPPHPSVMRKLLKTAREIGKPVVANFVGAREEFGGGITRADTLEEAAILAVGLARGEKTDKVRKELHSRDDEIRSDARKMVRRLAPSQRYVRGLFSGGTFCAEAQVILRGKVKKAYSNAPVEPFEKLKDSWKSVGHSMVDFGEDEFTVGRPHPMIDYSLRNRKILEEAENPETAVILLDVVLGWGSNLNPIADLAPVLETALEKAAAAKRCLPIICSVTGTDQDPQSRRSVVEGLQRAGATVLPSNAAASLLAAETACLREAK
ncbi:MAG: acyl-CoA synthetase FdrA [Pseudomonadota bacterium]